MLSYKLAKVLFTLDAFRDSNIEKISNYFWDKYFSS